MKEIRPELVKDKTKKQWAQEIKDYVQTKNITVLRLHALMFDFIREHVDAPEGVTQFVYQDVPIVKIKR